MKRLLAVSLLPLALCGCAARSDLFLAWTVDGGEASSNCKSFSKPKLQAHVLQRDAKDDVGADEDFDLDCKAGAASVAVADFADIHLELTSGKDVFAVSSSSEVNAGAGGEFDGSSADKPLKLDLRVTQGRLEARLTVNGADCGDAGVTSFNVDLRENVAPLQDDTIVDDETVTCEDGVATFAYGPVQIGATYKVSATATGFATNDNGEGVVVAGGVTSFVADLVTVP